MNKIVNVLNDGIKRTFAEIINCLLYTSDAADE